MKAVCLTPAILTSNLSEAKKEISAVCPFSSLVQLDIIDGKFAPEITVMPSALKQVKIPCDLELHLMVNNPSAFVDDCFKARAKQVLFHYESTVDISDVIKRIKRRKMKAGIVLNPETPASKVKPFLKIVDMVQVMGVHPGKQGQRFLLPMLRKIRQLRAFDKNLEIAVDGGITYKTAPLAVAAGANRLVIGSSIFKTKVPLVSFIELCEEVNCRLN